MAGTSEGAKKAARTRKKHQADAFKKMGAKGGSRSRSNKKNK